MCIEAELYCIMHFKIIFDNTDSFLYQTLKYKLFSLTHCQNWVVSCSKSGRKQHLTFSQLNYLRWLVNLNFQVINTSVYNNIHVGWQHVHVWHRNELSALQSDRRSSTSCLQKHFIHLDRHRRSPRHFACYEGVKNYLLVSRCSH